MNLIVATRADPLHLHLEVSGKWRYGDALSLAYLVKAAAVKAGMSTVLLDLRRVETPAESEGRFLICNRLGRAMAAPMRIALVAKEDLVDGECESGLSHTPADISCFTDERPARTWLAP